MKQIMKNIILLLPILLFLTACECDETHPLANIEEIAVPDVFVVTGLGYTTAILDNEPKEGIIITFNRPVNEQSVIAGETFFLEGEDVFYQSDFYVDSNRIIIFCGWFYCKTVEGCSPTIRLNGIFSTTDEVLDGDRDGKPGGTFAEDVIAGGCPLPAFQVSSIFPGEGTLAGDIANSLNIFISFTLPVDTTSAIIGENIRLIRKPDGAAVPFDEASWDSFGPYYLSVKILGPLRHCTFDPDCEFELIIEDSVRSQAGTALDGDYDDKEGGDYKIVYSIPG